eukprot:SAG31_NODE_21049_length_559_cov_0.667391_1_plen_142_part_10
MQRPLIRVQSPSETRKPVVWRVAWLVVGLSLALFSLTAVQVWRRDQLRVPSLSKTVDINKYHQEIPGEDLSRYPCVTVYGHHDGFGASYGAIVSGVVYAHLHGMEFRHTPTQTLAHWVPSVDGAHAIMPRYKTKPPFVLHS